MEIGGTIVAEEAPLQPVEPGYRAVLRVRYAIVSGVAAAISFVAYASFFEDTSYGGLVPVVALLIGLAAVIVLPQRVYRRLRYRLTDRLLQVMRGWMFHSDTVVPLLRVQHLDVVRGPLDKLFGTATLVVHTAGTLNSTVTVPGLAPERASEMRDTIRQHVRTDFQ